LSIYLYNDIIIIGKILGGKKMKNIKRFITTILSATLIMTNSISIFASPYNDVPDTVSYKNAIERLYGLGIMQGNNGSFTPDSNIIRGDLAKVILTSIGKSKLSDIKSKLFEDVNQNDYYLSYVNIAGQLGIMAGSNVKGKKYFKPKDNVTLAELTTIIVRCLGYKDSDLDGKWPFNYIAKGNDLKLFQGIENINPNTKVKRSDVAIMINNMLDTPIKAENNKEYPKSLFEVTKSSYEVTVTTGPIITTQFDSTIAANHVKINNVDYEIGIANPQDLINNAGKSVTAYAKDNKIFYITNMQGVSKTVFTSKDSTPSTIYFRDAGSTIDQTLTISSNAKLILNGAIATNITSIKSGANVTLIKSGTSNDYDFVIANQTGAQILITNDITSDDPIAVSNTTNLNLKKIDGTAAKVTVSGAASKLSEIKKYDIVYPSVSENNDVISLYIVRNSVKGVVAATTLATVDKLATVKILDNIYSVRAGLNINLGDNRTFILDKDNIIVLAIDNGGAQTSISLDNYGIITGSKITKDDWTDATKYAVRFTKLDGTEIVLQTAALVDLATYKGQLVTYSLDLNSIATIKPVGYTPLKKANIVSDTVLYAIRTNSADGNFIKIEKVNAKDINLVESTAAFTIIKSNSLIGDYAVVGLVNPASISMLPTEISGYGCVIGKTGSLIASDGITILDTYDIYVNGNKQSINVKKDYAIPSFFVKLIATNGIVTAGVEIPLNNKIIGKVVAVDNVNLRIRLNDNNTYLLDGNAKIYNISNNIPKLASMNDVTSDMINNAILIMDPTTNKIMMVMINK
jgi:hypothetical protein